MPLQVTFELSDDDLEHFRRIMGKGVEVARAKSEPEIIKPAQDLLKRLRDAGSQAPDFVTNQLVKLETIIDMVQDSEWQLPEDIKGHVLSALAYFSDPEDIIHDDIPGLGFLDDAIMVELVVAELGHEIEAYEEFCEYRRREEKHRGSEDVKREEWLEAKRQELHSRMRRRRRKGFSSGGRVRGTSFSLW